MAQPKRVSIAVVLLLAACGPGPAPSGAVSSPLTPAAGEPLECTVQGYPCTLAEVPTAVLERSNALGDEAATRVEGGSSLADAAAWLRSQSDMAEVVADDDALRFRVTGGPPIWVLGERALPDQAAAAPVRVASAAAAPGWLRPQQPVLATVTGGAAAQRSALVLSPMLWDFGDSDDGAPVSEILGATRGYEASVTYQSNATAGSTEVSIDDFRRWGDYDVVHVSSHGTRICDTGVCRAVIIATLFTGALADLPERGQPGVEIIKSVKKHRTFLGLSAAFFREEYPGGLQDTLVFFNACETYGAGSPADRATDLGDAIRGTTSVFLGWSEVVDSESATLAAVALFQGLSQRGLTVGDAYEGIGELKVDQHPEGKHGLLSVSERQAGGDLRIRDVVSLRSGSSGAILQAGESVAIEGEVGDGQPDAVPYRLQVEGVDAADAAAGIVHVSAAGGEAPPAQVGSGTVVGPGIWSFEGSITLDHDVVAPEAVDLRAWLELPEGGSSEHDVGALLVGPPPFASAWKGTATYVSKLTFDGRVTVRATAELTFTLSPGQDAGAAFIAYQLTSGTMTWQITGTDSEGCTSVSPVVTVAFAPEPASGEISLDMSGSPLEYRASANVTAGPEVEVTQTCPTKTNTYTTRANATFILASSDEDRTVVGDRISGQAALGVATMSWELAKVD